MWIGTAIKGKKFGEYRSTQESVADSDLSWNIFLEIIVKYFRCQKYAYMKQCAISAE